MFNKNSDNDYDYLLERAKLRLMSAWSAYENACREKNEFEAYLNSDLCYKFFLEMDKLEAEIQQAIGPEIPEVQLGMFTVRRINFIAT